MSEPEDNPADDRFQLDECIREIKSLQSQITEGGAREKRLREILEDTAKAKARFADKVADAEKREQDMKYMLAGAQEGLDIATKKLTEVENEASRYREALEQIVKVDGSHDCVESLVGFARKALKKGRATR